MIDEPGSEAVAALEGAMQGLGAVFIEENGGGIGVRLKFTGSEAKRIARMEAEGGITSTDRVP